ncbi:agamous-like MADS-box protein AGL17 [Cryptomeria japonica]|uniref:agamous-like MADS-box protein AGL17 n=1 Tax=Cryptomeria japonica TaxID=3369 RepID=UPI0025ABC15D|nr:agamous-like MADS-box protein AGL17 [Cryptomeria japonica]
MGRAKIPIKWIPKDTSRNVSFIKRKRGLRKKIEELSILCGVDACMVCYGPHSHTDQHTSSSSPDVWPDISKALEVIDRYRRLSKEEQDKKKLDNSTFLEQRIKKLRSELNLTRKESKDLEMDILYPCWDNCLNDLGVEKLRDLLEYIDVKLEAVQSRINFLTRQQEHKTCHAGNDIMDHADRKPLLYHPSNSHMMMYHNHNHNHNHNLLLSMPYQSQESLSLTAAHVQPYLSLEEQQCYKNHFGATSAIDYHAKGNPIIFTAVKDPQPHSQHTANSLAFGSNYSSTSNKDKVEIAGMGMDDRILVENAATHVVTRKNLPFISDHHVHSGHWTPCCTVFCPCPEHYHGNMGSSYGSQTIQELQASAELQWMVHSLMDEQNTNYKQLGGEGMGIDLAHTSPGAASSRINEEFNMET